MLTSDVGCIVVAAGVHVLGLQAIDLVRGPRKLAAHLSGDHNQSGLPPQGFIECRGMPRPAYSAVRRLALRANMVANDPVSKRRKGSPWC